jgi:quercetin dioxygenase-like cupin family protein
MARKEEVKLDRRELLMLGLAGASSLVLGNASSVLAAEKKGKETKIIKQAESFIPGFAKLRLREVTWQPGGMEGERPMPNAMVCECTAGSFETTVDGKTIVRKKGDIWTCKPGQVISDVNKGKTVAVMRIFDLLPA